MDLIFIYLDNNNNLIDANKKKIKNTEISKETLLDVIQTNSKTFILNNLLQFTEKKEPYLTPISFYNDVKFEEDVILKTLYFIYKKKLKHNTTKKVILSYTRRKTKRKVLKATNT